MVKYKELDFKPVVHHSNFRFDVKHKLISELVRGDDVIDLGCGWYTNPYLKGAVGVDLETITKPNNYKEMITADLNGRIPVSDNSYDTVIASGVIEHLYNYHGFLMECKRILRKNGILIIDTANRIPNRMIAKKNMLHILEWSYSEFIDLLEHFFVFQKSYGLMFTIPIIRININLKKFPRLSNEVIYVCKNEIDIV